METIHIILSIGGLVTLAISIAAFIRLNRTDAAGLASEITMLKQKIANLQDIVNAISVAEIASMKQSLSDLRARVERLDTDVEKKIDQLSAKIDKLSETMQKILLEMSKH